MLKTLMLWLMLMIGMPQRSGSFNILYLTIFEYRFDNG